MKIDTKTAFVLLALWASATALSAQDLNPPDQPPPPPPENMGEFGGPPPHHHHRPPPPPPRVLLALDANRDRVIDAQEIANATNALLALDENHDGQLTPDEVRPRGPFPGGPHHPPPPPPPPGEAGERSAEGTIPPAP